MERPEGGGENRGATEDREGEREGEERVANLGRNAIWTYLTGAMDD